VWVRGDDDDSSRRGRRELLRSGEGWGPPRETAEGDEGVCVVCVEEQTRARG
jgi:hypothetical protein